MQGHERFPQRRNNSLEFPISFHLRWSSRWLSLVPPYYLHLDLPKHHDVMRNVSMFRLRAHTLAVKSFIWRGGNGHCDKFSCAAVQNEVHVLFTVKPCLCALSKKVTWSFSSLFAIPCLKRPLLFFMPCLVRLDFLSQPLRL